MTRPQEQRGELTRANAAANDIFARMGQAVQEAIDRGQTELDVLEVARRSGLEIEERDIDELHIDIVLFMSIPGYRGTTGGRGDRSGAGGGIGSIGGTPAARSGGTAAIGIRGDDGSRPRTTRTDLLCLSHAMVEYAKLKELHVS